MHVVETKTDKEDVSANEGPTPGASPGEDLPNEKDRAAGRGRSRIVPISPEQQSAPRDGAEAKHPHSEETTGTSDQTSGTQEEQVGPEGSPSGSSQMHQMLGFASLALGAAGLLKLLAGDGSKVERRPEQETNRVGRRRRSSSF